MSVCDTVTDSVRQWNSDQAVAKGRQKLEVLRKSMMMRRGVCAGGRVALLPCHLLSVQHKQVGAMQWCCYNRKQVRF